MEWMHKLPSLRNVLGSLIAGSLLTGQVVVVGAALAYKTPPNPVQSTTDATTTGSRNCGTSSDENLMLLALAPRQHVGETAFTHPTFVWYVPDTREFPVEFELYEIIDALGNRNKLIEAEFSSTQGFMTFSMPQNLPGLTPGKNYAWQVSVKCDENDVASFTTASAELVLASRVIGQSLDPMAADRLEQINHYAERGLWYDAIGLASLNPTDSSLDEMQTSIIESLADLEDLDFSEQLRSTLSE